MLVKIQLKKSFMPWAIQLQISLILYKLWATSSNLPDFVNIWMIGDRFQDLNSVTCSIFQIYFFDNLFDRNKNSKIQNKKRLNQRTIETLLNKLVVLDDQDKNEATIQQYASENNILLQWLTDLLLRLLYKNKTDNFRLQKWVRW